MTCLKLPISLPNVPPPRERELRGKRGRSGEAGTNGENGEPKRIFWIS